MSSPHKPHALILPYPAQGHVIPLMELSYCLIERGFRITFINTQFNHERVFAAMAPNQDELISGESGSRIRFVTIPDGLEAEEDRHDFGRLTKSLMTVMPSFLEELLINNSAESTCFIADINIGWAFTIAKNAGFRTAAFWPAATGLLAILFSLPKLIQDGVIDQEGAPMKKDVIQLIPEMPKIDTMNLPWNCFFDTYTQKIMFETSLANGQAAAKADMIICNSFEKLEESVFNKLPYLLPIGPLLNSFESRGDPNLCHFWPQDKQCISWLDGQPKSSVIYVAFGSITIFDNKQFQELALGLELTGRPFLWVVRPNLTKKSNNCSYPFGFEEKVSNRGRMIAWSPQHKVLKHPAIACFISHCGWNSTIEAVVNGVPFLCWPYFADQFFNESYITNIWKIGLSLVPNENGLISREEVGTKVEELLKDKDILERSQAMKEFSRLSVMEGGSSFENLNKIADLCSN